MAVYSAKDIIFRVTSAFPNADLPDLLYIINQEQKRVAAKRRWRYYQDTYDFNFTESYTTGTVSVTEGSATVTGSGTTFTSGMEGRKFSLDGVPGIYTVSTYVSATEITLDRVWARDSETDSEYAIFQDTYDLPTDVRSLLLVRNLKTGHEIELVSNTERLAKWRHYGQVSYFNPDSCAQWGVNSTTGAQQLIFNGAPEDADPVQVVYYRNPVALVDILDTIDVPDILDEAVYLGVLISVIRRVRPDAMGEIQFTSSDYTQAVRDAIRQDSEFANPHMRNVAGRAFSL